MLTSWTLENFKPIHGALDLALGRITVLAGLNSSGKSSVLQSILLVSQTLANQNLDRPLVLNGNLVQLGTFDGVHNDHASDPHIKLGFHLDLPPPQNARLVSSASRSGFQYFPFREGVRSIRLLASFASSAPTTVDSSAIEAVRVQLIGADITVEGELLGARRGRLSRRDAESSSSPIAMAAVSAHVALLNAQDQDRYLVDVRSQDVHLLPYPEGANYAVRMSATNLSPSSDEILLGRLAHFLPNRFIGKFDLAERRRFERDQGVRDLLNPNLPIELVMDLLARADHFGDTLSRFVGEDELRVVNEAVSSHDRNPPFTGGSIRDLVTWFRSNPRLAKESADLRQAVRHALEAMLPAEPENEDPPVHSSGLEVVRGRDDLEAFEYAMQELTKFATSMIRYLGPLRADAQAAQGFAPSSEPDDVGLKGEYAAAVYDGNRARRIRWWHPVERRERGGSLEEAMDTWVRYLGVAHRVATREAGLAGFSWMVQHRPTARERPLAAVGVGVSQVLPILVAGLLAPSDAVLIFEQPELHLHARAQARLAEFFLGLSQVGKQCIIETHSDCLVNQFRYHIVSRDLASREDLAIYFVEQDSEGDAQFTPIEISQYGNVMNWPDGFFDESLHQEDRITQASVLARANP